MIGFTFFAFDKWRFITLIMNQSCDKTLESDKIINFVYLISGYIFIKLKLYLCWVHHFVLLYVCWLFNKYPTFWYVHSNIIPSLAFCEHNWTLKLPNKTSNYNCTKRQKVIMSAHSYLSSSYVLNQAAEIWSLNLIFIKLEANYMFKWNFKGSIQHCRWNLEAVIINCRKG